MDKSDQTSMDGANNTVTVTSKKSQQKGNTPSMDPAKPPSALAKQEVKNIPRGTERDMPGRAGAATAQAAGGETTEAPHAKFHSSCFGAVSYKEKAIGDTFQSLVTASDTEEELGALQSSPVL